MLSLDSKQFFLFPTYLRDCVGGAGVGQGGGLGAVSGEGGHNLGGVSDVALGGDTSSNSENGGERGLHFERYYVIRYTRQRPKVIESSLVCMCVFL